MLRGLMPLTVAKKANTGVGEQEIIALNSTVNTRREEEKKKA